MPRGVEATDQQKIINNIIGLLEDIKKAKGSSWNDSINSVLNNLKGELPDKALEHIKTSVLTYLSDLPEIKSKLESELSKYFLVEVFKDTQKKSSMSKSSLNSTVVFDKEKDDLSKIQPVSYPEPSVEVLNIDSFEAAKKMKEAQEGDAAPPLVLNLANRFWVGGGVTKGSKAQEEDLMRRSNYYMALSQDKFSAEVATGGNAGRAKYKTPIPEFGSMYTPSVSVFKSPDYQDIPPFEVACVAVAGYDLGKNDDDFANDRKLFLDKNGNFDIKLFEKATKEKIRHMLDVALFKGHTTLVLGALSCGAFQLKNQPGVTAEAVANAYKAVLLEPEYKNKFKHIVFAVLDKDPNPTSNFTIFHQALSGLSAQLKSDPLTSTPVPEPSLVGDQKLSRSLLANLKIIEDKLYGFLALRIQLGASDPDLLKLKDLIENKEEKTLEDVQRLLKAMEPFKDGRGYFPVSLIQDVRNIIIFPLYQAVENFKKEKNVEFWLNPFSYNDNLNLDLHFSGESARKDAQSLKDLLEKEGIICESAVYPQGVHNIANLILRGEDIIKFAKLCGMNDKEIQAMSKANAITSTSPPPNPVPTHFATTVPIVDDVVTSTQRTFIKTDLSPTPVGKGTNISIDKVHDYALLHKADFSSFNLEGNEWHGTLINNQKIHAKQESNSNGVQFSIQKNLFDGKDLEAFKEIVTKLCDMAVWSAGEGTEFKISQKLKDKANDSSLSKEERYSYNQKVNIMEKAFDAAIEVRAKDRADTGQPPEENPPYREGKATVLRTISAQKLD